MKLLFLLVGILWSTNGFSQRKSEWYFQTNTNLLCDFSFQTGVTPGVGTYFGYSPDINLFSQLKPRISIGFESTPAAWFSKAPNHFWYNQNIRVNLSLDRKIQSFSNRTIWIGLGTSIFVGEMITGRGRLFDQAGQLLEISQQTSIEGAFSIQASFRYKNPNISSKMNFGHSIDWVVAHRSFIQSFSLFWLLSEK